MPTKLLLIRHGQTSWNLEKRYCGCSDINLNHKGKAEARKLYQRLKKEEIHKVYSSDKKRTFNFARIVFRDKQIEKIPDLKELNFGIFEGLTYKQIMEKYPRIYKQWLKTPLKINIPQGENLGDFKKRVIKTFKNIVSTNKNKTVAVVCHGGPISIFINHILKSKGFWKQIPNSASLSIIEYKNNQPKIRLLNDTSHL